LKFASQNNGKLGEYSNSFRRGVAPFCGPTRTEEDFLAHAQAVVATDPQVTRWHVVCENLNIHQSEALVLLSSPIWKGLSKRR
jgi:hypothetical protein